MAVEEIGISSALYLSLLQINTFTSAAQIDPGPSSPYANPAILDVGAKSPKMAPQRWVFVRLLAHDVGSADGSKGGGKEQRPLQTLHEDFA